MDAIITLSVLEAVRASDRPASDTDEAGDDGAIKLGRTTSVAAQIARYEGMVRRRESVDPVELDALFRLVGRRDDAALVFTDAGRRAGRHALRRLPAPARWTWGALPSALRYRWGARLVAKAATNVLRCPPSARDVWDWSDSGPAPGATSGGVACALYGSAIAELLRMFTPFDGAVFHISCVARGDDGCVWSTGPDGGAETG